MPDHLTGLGVAAAAAIAAAYALSSHGDVWLWVASGLLVVHWLGDSLDGTLARVRRTERPRYGYYLDHLVDAVATAMIGIGLGLSPHLLLATGLLVVIAYLVLSINTYLETQSLGVFSLGYGRVGPTEARIALIGLNTAMALGVPLHFTLAGVSLSALDVAALAVVAVMLVALAVRAARNLRELAAREPLQATG
jgi:phosphatidylglycerophosphate synthase